MSEFRANLKRGVFWTAIDKYSGQLIGIGISMILARLLTPDDYGIVATATVFIGFINIFTSIGIGPAVIQRKDLNKTDLNDIFTFTVIIGLVCSAITFICSWPISKFYHDPVLIPVTQLLAINVFLGAINMVPSALMAKNMRFKEMAKRSLMFQIIFGILGIISAFYGAGIYALILPPIIASGCTFIYNNSFYPVKLNLRFSIEPIKQIFSFSSYLFLFEVFNYFSRNLDKIIIGKYISTDALGYYEKSYRLMQMPMQNITSVIYPVLQPVLSTLQNDLSEISGKFTKIVGILALVGFPLCGVLYFCADEIIIVMFGEQWKSSIPVFKILSLSVPLMLIVNPTGPVFLSCNASKMLFFTGVINTTITIFGFLIAAYFQKNIEAIAWAWTITLFVNSINSYYRLYVRVMKQSLIPVIKNLLHPAICLILISITYYLCDKYLILSVPLFFLLVVKAAIGCVVGILYYSITHQFNLKTLINEFKRS